MQERAQEKHRCHTLLLEKFLNDPKTEALRAYDRQRFSVHIAVIIKRGKIIAEATNAQGSRSSGSGYSTYGIHAEKNCVKQLGDISKLRGADMIVMRLSRGKTEDGEREFLESKPCDECHIFLEKCMREYGLRNVYYTSS
jgi:hypothetical protein